MNKVWMAGVAACVAFTAAASPVWAASRTVTVQSGDSMWTIAQANGVSLKGLEAANPTVKPQALLLNTVLSVPGTVTVKAGNTLWKIAATHGTTVAALEAVNPGTRATDLQIGTVLTLPPAASSSQKPAVAPSVSAATPSTASQNLYWMEHVINAEAGGLGLKAQIAVGDVVLHRLQSGQYGSTVKDVVFEVLNGHYQFTSVQNRTIYHTPSARSDTAAVDVLKDGTDEVPGALVFYNPSKTPASSWVRKQPVLAQLGPMVFAK